MIRKHSYKKWIIGWIGIAIIAMAFTGSADRYFDIAKNLDIFTTLFKEVNTYYVDEVDPEKLIKVGIDGMLETLDPYTVFIEEKEEEAFRISITGQYGGIGALIALIRGKAVITHPYPNFPAYEAGIKVGDEIIQVNGINVEGKSTREISTLLKGQPNSEVKVGVRRFGKKEPLIFSLSRQKISVGNIPYYGVLDSGIGYIRLDDFTGGASREMAQAVQKLKDQGATKLILDLRYNPGGLLQEAINVVGLFIPKGVPVVSTRGKSEDWNKTYKSLSVPLDPEIPMVVLVSENSASASEIVAGAFQDYDRAVLVGRRTFGKGLVQTTRPLGYHTQLKITTAKYYTPSGRCIQKYDYLHRDENQKASVFADSLKRQFRTQAGRLVYDGQGLDPDFQIKQKEHSPIGRHLVAEGWVFDYATQYSSTHPQPKDLVTFRLSGGEYDQFVKWVKGNDFEYISTLEKKADDLKEEALKEGVFKQMTPLLEDLKKNIQAGRSGEFEHHRAELSELLERQIAFHYQLDQGEFLYTKANDQDLLRAVEILKDSLKYKQALFPVHP